MFRGTTCVENALRSSWVDVNEMATDLVFHGLRPQALNVDGWCRLMTKVIRQEWIGVGASPATRETESQLGIAGDPMYFFAMRSERAFGLVVFAARLRRVTGRKDKGATPFDSGGLWRGKIQVSHTLDAHQRKELFRTHDIALTEFREKFDAYVRANYASFNEYVVGEPPRHGTPPIIPRRPNKSRAWTWEVRVPKAAASEWAELVCGFITPKAMSTYKKWLDYDSGIEDAGARSIHLWISKNMKLAPEGVAASEFAKESMLAGAIP